MKKIIILTAVFLSVNKIILAQGVIGGFSFCHTLDKKLSSCTEGYYTLQFDKQQFKKFITKDSNILFDVDKKYFQFKKKRKVAITLQLQNESQSIILQDKRSDTTYSISFLKDGYSCESQPNSFANIYYDSTMITLNYSYCRLTSIGIVDVQMGSFNFIISQLIGKEQRYWDVYFNQMDTNKSGSKGVKILSNKKNGKLDLISLFNETRLELHIGEAMPGVEILSLPKKSNRFYKVRLVTDVKNSKQLNYEDVIVYDKKGMVNFSKFPIENCL